MVWVQTKCLPINIRICSGRNCEAFSSVNQPTATVRSFVLPDNDSMIRYEKSVLKKDTNVTQARELVIESKHLVVNNERWTNINLPDFKWHFKSVSRSNML